MTSVKNVKIIWSIPRYINLHFLRQLLLNINVGIELRNEKALSFFQVKLKATQHFVLDL